MEAAATHSLGGTQTGTNRWLISLFPSLTDLAFIWPALLLFVLLPGSVILLSDGDTGWHIRTGEWIWQHKAVPMADLFSFTKPHAPWFAWEWGWDLLFAGIHHWGGLGAVAFASVVILCTVSALLFLLIRRHCDRDVLALAFTVLAMTGSTIHWLARPHLVSWLFILIFAHVILSAERGNKRVLFCLPALMLLWVNLHGAFFVGIVMLLTNGAGEILSALFVAEPFGKAAWRRSKPYILCALACLATTFINPYTWRLHQHIIHYITDSRLLDKIAEFQSINFHGLQILPFECMLLLGIGTAFWCAMNRQFGAALSILLWAHWSLQCGRNAPLFLLVSTPFAACFMKELIRRLHTIQCFGRDSSRCLPSGTSLQVFERLPRLHLISFAALLVVALGFVWDWPGFEAHFNPKSFPVKALSFVRMAKFSRLFTTDQWADYLIYHLYPAQPTYLDGRSDLFGTELAERYRNIINAKHDWDTNLHKDKVDAVMLRPDAPIVSALKESKHWKLLFDNGDTVIFQSVPTRQPLSESSVDHIQVSPTVSSGRKAPGRLASSAASDLRTKS